MALAFVNETLNLHRVAIETDRLRLLAVTSRYTEQIFREFTPAITRYMLPAPARSIADTQAFVAAALASLDSREELHLVITMEQDGEFLGVCGLHARQNPAEPELGIWIKRGAHGHGYGLEAIAALRSWADENLEFRRLIYPVDRRNVASVRIPELLGGTVIDERIETNMSGAELDELVYAIPGKAR